MIKKIVIFFDKLEDVIRASLSKYPIVYALIGGIFVVLFWRGVWHTADMLQDEGGVLGFLFYEPVNAVISVVALLMTGLFVSFFIGDTILITGLKKEKKVAERTESEVKEEAEGVAAIRSDIKKIKDELSNVHDDMVNIKSEVDDIKEVTDGQKEI